MKTRTLILPNVRAMMTGVWRIDRQLKDGLTTLTYTDGSKESAVLDSKEWSEDNEFSIIGTVQDRARTK